MTNPWEVEYESGSTEAAPWEQDYEQQSFTPAKLGKDAFADYLREELANQNWITRNVAGAGSSIAQAYEGLKDIFGKADEQNLANQRVIADEAPVGAFVGEVAKYAPVALAGPALLPAAGIAAGIGAATTPGSIGTRATSGAVEGGLTALGGAVWKAPAAIRKMGSDYRAKDALRQIYGADADEASKLAARASIGGENVTSAQALSELDNPVMAALEKLAIGQGSNPAESAVYFNRLETAQKAAQREQLERMARGSSAAESQTARKAMKDRLNKALAPVRERELGAVNTATRETARLTDEVNRMGTAAANKVEDVRRMTAAGQRAEGLAGSAYPVPGMPRVPGRYTYMDELAQSAERVAGQSADASLRFGDAARFAQAKLDALAAHGLKPLDVGKVTRGIQAIMSRPGIRMSQNTEKVLNKISKLIEKKTAQFGVLDAEDLYQLKKEGIGEAIDSLLKSKDPIVSKKLAASLTREVGPMIDEAIESAGGTQWGKYLRTYASGMDRIGRVKLADVGRYLHQHDPKGFMDFVKGEKPDVINKIMSGKLSIDEALTPRGSAKMKQIAKEMARDARIKELAADPSSARALAGVIEQKGFKAALPKFLNRYVVLANEALKQGNMKVSEGMYRSLEKAVRDPGEFVRLMNLLPPEQRFTMYKMIDKSIGMGIPQTFAAAEADFAMSQ